MTSSTSSEPTTTRFPPRDHLPPGVAIKPLPGFGTTWYDHSSSYWVRRGGVALFTAVLVAVWTFIVGAIIHHSGPTGSPGFLAMLIAEIVVSLVTGVWEFRKIWKRPHRWTSRDEGRARMAGAWAGGLGSLIRAGNLLAGFVVGVLALLSYGGVLAVFVISLAPELPREREARRLLASDLEKYRFIHHDRSTHKRKHR